MLFKKMHTTDSITTSFVKGVWLRKNTTDLYPIYYPDDVMFRPLYKEENYSLYVH